MRLNFRAKLLLAMMVVVLGVSVATLMITQRRVRANYERMFRSQFERQIGYFTALQEARLGAVKEQCLKFSQSTRLFAFLNEETIDSPRLYQTARNELRELFDDAPGNLRPSGPPDPRRLRAVLLFFLDAQGKPLPPQPDTLFGRVFGALMKRRSEGQYFFVREALAGAEPQQVGYLAFATPTNEIALPRRGLRRAGGPRQASVVDAVEPTIQEVIVTKVIDSTTGRMVGALVLGFPLPELVPQPAPTEAGTAKVRSEIIQSGILLEERLYADSDIIPDSVGEIVAQRVTERIRATGNKRADFNADLNGASYRVFYELMNADSAFPPAYQVCLYSMEEARHELNDLRLKILGSGAGALALGFVFSLFLSHGLTAPVRELVAGTGEIQRGNYDVRVRQRSRDEIGQLAASFNEMAEGLTQKEKYRTVLNMVADERVAQRMVAGELTLGGELREISVLFCDIRGFTALTQNMPPAEVIEMLNEHMTALTGVVKENNGLLDKFVGDLLMAIFGAPVSHGQDTFNAARCARRLLEVRAQLNQTSKHKIEVGIGLATGTVVAGCMGSADRLNYTVLGERVNLASRLCSQAKAGEAVIDESTREKLAEQITVEPTGEIRLKGFSAPIQAYRLLEVRSQVEPA